MLYQKAGSWQWQFQGLQINLPCLLLKHLTKVLTRVFLWHTYTSRNLCWESMPTDLAEVPHPPRHHPRPAWSDIVQRPRWRSWAWAAWGGTQSESWSGPCLPQTAGTAGWHTAPGEIDERKAKYRGEWESVYDNQYIQVISQRQHNLMYFTFRKEQGEIPVKWSDRTNRQLYSGGEAGGSHLLN